VDYKEAAPDAIVAAIDGAMWATTSSSMAIRTA
jgi:hypothetical protein